MKKLFFLALTICLTFSLKSQNITISGIIKDSTSSENLVGATIVEKQQQITTTCNEFGFYSVTLAKGQKTMLFDFIGYQSKEITINLTKDTVIDIDLIPQNIEIEKVIVTGKNSNNNSYNLPISKISKMPVVAGETDVLKSLVLSPGVTAGNEGSASLNVRGGNPDQNLFLLDGIPVYNVNHVFGFSLFLTQKL